MTVAAASTGRFPALRYAELDGEQRALWDGLLAGPRGAKAVRPEGYLTGPFNALLRAPRVGGQLAGLGTLLRFESELSAVHRELVIVLVAAHWRAAFAWNSHAVYAREAGVPVAVLDAIAAGKRPVLDDPGDQLVVDYVRDLLRTGTVAAERFAALRELLGDRGAVELIVLAGYYSLESFVLNSADVPLPTGGQVPWASDPSTDQDRNRR